MGLTRKFNLTLVALGFLLLSATAYATTKKTPESFVRPAEKASSAMNEKLSLVREAQKNLQESNYKEAQKHFSLLASKYTRDASFQYYLAMCALHNKDYGAAKQALNRVFVQQPEGSVYGKTALSTLKRYQRVLSGARAYYCGRQNRIMSWPRSSMPVKVYISDGLSLPQAYSGKSPEPARLLELHEWLKNPQAYQTMQRAQGYKNSFRSLAASGLAQWDWARKENIVQYELVTDPNLANILIFWTKGFDRAGCCGQTLYMVTNAFKIPPVIVEIKSDWDNTPLNYQSLAVTSTAAHEFGHAIGIIEHSPILGDLMYAQQGAPKLHADGHIENPPNKITENDKETLRALYSISPSMNF